MFTKQNKKQLSLAITLASVTIILTPTAFALTSVTYIIKMIDLLLGVFRAAGLLLLVYAIFSFILSIKNEDAESKVNAIMHISIAIVLITLSSILSELFVAAGITSITI